MPDSLELENPTRQIENVIALLPPKIRDKAHDILNQSGARQVQLLTRVISKERAKRRLRAKATALPGSLLLAASLLTTRSHTFGGYSAALGLSGLSLLALSATTLLPSRLEKAAREALLQSEETSSIGPLLEGLHKGSPAVRAQARERLIRLLPQITPETFRKLTSDQRGYLYAAVNHVQRSGDLDLTLSVLIALQEAGDERCLGAVYRLAVREAATEDELAVRDAARDCIERLYARLDFGPLESLPRHISSISAGLRVGSADFQDYVTSLLTLSRLLPQLTPANYERILSANHCSQLYGLLLLYAAAGSGMYWYRRRDLHLEIVRTAERMGDTRAIDILQEFAGTNMAGADEELYTAVCRTLSALEELADSAV